MHYNEAHEGLWKERRRDEGGVDIQRIVHWYCYDNAKKPQIAATQMHHSRRKYVSMYG